MLPIYPNARILRGLGYSVKWSPQFFNMDTQTAPSGADIDLALADTPLHDFELTYNFLRDGGPRGSWKGMTGPLILEFKTLMGFWLALGGSSGRFAFEWPDDKEVAQQLVGTGDGTTTTFTLERSFGANGFFGSEPVGIVNTAEPFNIYLGDVATPYDTSLYSLNTANPCAQTITFATAPTAGQQVRVDMSYFYYCKFPDNQNTFEKFMNHLWTLNKMTIHSCRAWA